MIGRRVLLLVGGAATVAAATGCSVSDPRILGGPPTPPPDPPVTPLPRLAGLDEALITEADLGALAGQLRDRAAALRLPGPSGALAAGAASAHAAHLTALRGPRPAERPTTVPTPDRRFSPRPEPTSMAQLPVGDGAAVVRGVTDRLGRAAEAYRVAARASQGSTALLWGSLAAYASGLALALPSGLSRPAPPTAANRPLDPWSDTEAAQQTVRQLHAVIYGYQAAHPAFRGAEAKTLFELLYRRRDQRDRLTTWLRARGQAVPAAEAVYALPVQPADRGRAVDLLGRMEVAYQPFVGALLAAGTDEATRRTALDALEEATRLGVQWGAALPVWPGWPG